MKLRATSTRDHLFAGLLAVTSILMANLAARLAAATPPNLIVIMADDKSYDLREMVAEGTKNAVELRNWPHLQITGNCEGFSGIQRD